MSPLNSKQLEHIRDERRDQIKHAALQVFAECGIDGAKMSMIATRAGVSHGLFYRYFESKEALYSELVEELFARADEVLAGLETGAPDERLLALTQRMLSPVHRNAFLLVQRARLHLDPPGRVRKVLRRSTPDMLVARIVPMFVRGQRKGTFVAGDAHALLTAYFSIVDAITISSGPPPPAEMLLRMLQKCSTHGA